MALPQNAQMDALFESILKLENVAECRKYLEDLCTVKEARPFPRPSELFRSYRCACCGEMTGENWIRLVNGEYRCLDCIEEYDRFNV